MHPTYLGTSKHKPYLTIEGQTEWRVSIADADAVASAIMASVTWRAVKG
jgi:hypothetical protein